MTLFYTPSLISQLLQRLIFAALITLSLCSLYVSTASAEFNSIALKHGAVIARSIVLDKNNQPILVEYNADGSEGNVISIPAQYKNNVADLSIISAYEYHQQEKLLQDYKDHYKDTLAKGADLMTRDQFLGQSYQTTDGNNTIKPQAAESIKSMLVRGRSNRITTDSSQLILVGFTVDLTQSVNIANTGSVVLNPKGEVIASSSLNIAPRVGFYGDANKAQDASNPVRRKSSDTIFGPIPNVKITTNLGSLIPPAYTDEQGKYSFMFSGHMCNEPIALETDIVAELYYSAFAPRGAVSLPYILRAQDWTYCSPQMFNDCVGEAILGINNMCNTFIAPNAGSDITNIDLKVDVMFLSGRVLLRNTDGSGVLVGDATEYSAEPASTNAIAQQQYDFDGDGKPDRAEVGTVTTLTQANGTVKKIFNADPQGTVQAVYFSSHTDATEPDVIRQVDMKKNLGNNIKLKSISKDDLKKTDMLIFREATGELVMERRGLRDSEISGRVQNGLTQDNKYFYYNLMLRGPMDSALNLGATSRLGSWSDWATRNQLTESFRKPQSDQLKPGEWVRLVVINRATGFMNAARVQLSSAGETVGQVVGLMNMPVPDMSLTPPNLKIWAERNYTQENGLNKNEETKNNIIGAEGAALTSDDDIIIYSEWFDFDGRPLPEGLGADNGEQYGLSGRLAKVVASNQIDAVAANGMANFPIAPGKHTQVLKVRDNLSSPEHYYVHVSGTQVDEKPDFGNAGNAAEAPFDSRPKNLTPFLTPIYDENSDWKIFSTWNQAKKTFDAQEENGTNGNAIEPTKPLPTYVWGYRPEYQFSQLSLEVNSIKRQYTDEAGEVHEGELLSEQTNDHKIPTIRSSDDLISMFYSLVGAQNDRLFSFDGEQHLVFALGAEEVTADVSATGQITFGDLSHIDRLDPTDFLTIRLYMNGDAGNTLWEWAFTRNGLHVYYGIPGDGETRQGKEEPDVEILSLLEKDELGTAVNAPTTELEIPTVRTLGGIRLRYRYIPPSTTGAKISKLTWKINYPGRYCTHYGVDECSAPVAANAEYIMSVEKGNVGDGSMYWEPVAGTAANWSNWGAAGVSASLSAIYTIPAGDPNVNPSSNIPSGSQALPAITKTYDRKFVIKTRELKPGTVANPVKGSDVQILEAMLWQLGISPSNGMGTNGTRLAAINRANYVAGIPSVVKMLRRFQGRTNANCDDSTAGSACVADYAGDSSLTDGNVDNKTLTQLQIVWKDYYGAVTKIDPVTNKVVSGVIKNPSVDNYKTAAAGWNENTDKFLPNTYTASVHQQMLVDSGKGGGSENWEVLRAWQQQESDLGFWGQGKPQTNYRIFEGGADEFGSIGWSQIKYGYAYNENLGSCSPLDGMNLYDPGENLKALIIYNATSQSTLNLCKGGFYLAFAADANHSGWKYKASNDADLVGYTQTGLTGIQKVVVGRIDDTYERLIKAIILYNGGADTKETWAAMLKMENPGLDENGKLKIGWKKSNRKYGIEVMRRFGVAPRTYIWKGGKNPDDMPIIGSDGLPEKKPDGTNKINSAAGKDWCFAYGESEWMSGKTFKAIKVAASSEDENQDFKKAIGQISCP